MKNSIESEVKTVFSLLKENRFVVPWHQRYYDWNVENVKELLDDLSTAYEGDAPIYFLGTIMLIKSKDDRWEINDGQQRLITLSLLFARLRQILSDMGDSARAKNALRAIFDIEEHDSPSPDEIKDLKPRIYPPVTDSINYGLLIQCRPIGRNGKMASATNCIDEFLQNKSSNQPRWASRFLDYITQKLQIIELQVGRGIDPNGIFETLNFRGKPLEDVDLMRNYFYSFFRHDDDAHKRKTVYNQMEGIYKKTLSSSKTLGEYMRCHLQAIYGYLQSKRLYSEVKKQIPQMEENSKDKVCSLVTNLAKNHRIEIYRLLKSPSSNADYWAKELKRMSSYARKSQNKRQIENYLKDLQRYTVAHPVLFALLCRYVETKDSNKKTLAPFVYACCKYISSFVTRVSHIQNFQPSHYELAFGDLAKSIMTKDCDTKEKFFEALQLCDEKTHIISDKQYVESLKNSRRISQPKSKELLFAVAEHQQTVLVNAKQCSIEHVLPQSLDYISGWPAFDKESHRDMVNCLGNMAILSVKENPSDRSANEDFSAKKEIYQNSDYKITKDICRYTEWSPVSIRKRQGTLAKVAARIWDFDGMNGKR